MIHKQVVDETTAIYRFTSNEVNKPLIRRFQTCKKSIFKRSVFFLFLVFIYRICLDIIYIQCIAPFWEYYNLTYEPEIGMSVCSWLLLIAFSYFAISFLDKPDSLISCTGILFFFIRFIPFTSFIACKAHPVDFVLLECVYWLLIFFSLDKIKAIHIPRIQKSHVLINCITIALVLTIVFISGRYTGFRLNFNLFNVYDLRAESWGFSMPSVLLYLWASASNVLPVILIYMIQKRKRLFSVFIVFIIFLNFSINGSKSTLFKMFFCFFFYFFMKKELVSKVPYLFVFLVITTLLEWWIGGSTLISTFIVRRVLYIPSLLDSLFYDYIQQIGPLYYQQGDVNITFLIGEEYFGREDMMANNGMFSDAFMNLGWIGCFIYPFIYAFYIKICDCAFKGVNRQIIFFSGLLIVTTMGSSVFTTALLTHGILLLCLVVYLLPREVVKKQ